MQRTKQLHPGPSNKLKHFYTCPTCNCAVGTWAELKTHTVAKHDADPPDEEDAKRRAFRFKGAFNAQGYSATPIIAQQVWDLSRLIQASYSWDGVADLPAKTPWPTVRAAHGWTAAQLEARQRDQPSPLAE